MSEQKLPWTRRNCSGLASAPLPAPRSRRESPAGNHREPRAGRGSPVLLSQLHHYEKRRGGGYGPGAASGTVCDNLKNIRRWLNVTKLYVPIFAVVARWLYGFGGGNGWPLMGRLPEANSVDSWVAWLKYHNADGSELELLRVAIEMKSALGASSGQREILLRERERRLGITQPIVMGRLLSQAEYAVAQGDPSTPLTGGGPSAGKVAASGSQFGLALTKA